MRASLIDAARPGKRIHAAKLVLDLWDLAHLAREGVVLDGEARGRVRPELSSPVALKRLERALVQLGIWFSRERGELTIAWRALQRALEGEVDRAAELLEEGRTMSLKRKLREAAWTALEDDLDVAEDEDLLELGTELDELADRDTENLDCADGCGALVISSRPTRLYASVRCRQNAQYHRDVSTPEGRARRNAKAKTQKAGRRERRDEVRELVRAGRPSVEDVAARLGLARRTIRV